MRSSGLFWVCLAVSATAHAAALCAVLSAPLRAPPEEGARPPGTSIRIRLISVQTPREGEPGETPRSDQAVEIFSDGAGRESSYWDLVRAAIAAQLRYPAAARRRRMEATIVLRLVLDREGRLAQVEVLSGDGDPLLVDAAVRAVRRAAPFPPPAEHGLPGGPLTAELPVSFAMNSR